MKEDEEKKVKIAKLILEAIKGKKVNISQEEIAKKIEVPPSAEMGDFAFPCFILSSKMKENPSEVSIEIRSKIKNTGDFSDIQTKGPYINFFMNRSEFASDLISNILSKDFGKFNKGNGETVMIEFSQANTHKAFHIGHLRGTSIGESVARILEFGGNKVVRANYEGDSGMHVAKWIWCYKKFHAKEKLKADEAWIASIYVDAVQRLEKNKDYQAEVEGINRSLESGDDEKLTELWKKTRELSLEAFEKIYSDLNTHFDIYFFEKDMEERGKEIVKALLENKVAKKSQGAIIMDLKKYNLGVWVLIRKDGTILYSGKDLALVEKKFEKYPKMKKSYYVIANEQDLHFQQLAKTLEISKFDYAKKIFHISYGMVRLPTGKMSSRTGNNILYKDFIKKVFEHTKREIKKRDPRLRKDILDDRAMKVSVAAIKYDMLRQGSNKSIIFDINEALNFEGNSGPYLLYSYARANSILNKSGKKPSKKSKNLDEKEMELIKKLSEFPDMVSKAYDTLNPSGIANYSYQLAQTFNEFYHKCPVVGSKKESFRLALVKSFMKILKESLSLLGIETLDEM